MSDVPETRDSLLLRAANPADHDAWQQFARAYGPVAYAVARRAGLQDADSHDVAQQVLISVSQSLQDWQKRDDGSRFRHWLFRIARNTTINMLTRRPHDRAAGGGLIPHSGFDPSEDNLNSAIELEYRRQLFRQAAEHVRAASGESTWNAFALTMIDGLSIAEAAAQLECSEGVIYASRSRIMRRLRDAIRKLEDD